MGLSRSQTVRRLMQLGRFRLQKLVCARYEMVHLHAGLIAKKMRLARDVCSVEDDVDKIDRGDRKFLARAIASGNHEFEVVLRFHDANPRSWSIDSTWTLRLV
jgi:hypothetical protein